MLINLRNAMVVGKRLPYDAEVEYLATTGGQYINTSIIGSSATKVEITAYSTNTTDYMSLFGARNANNRNRPSYSIWQRTTVAAGMRMRFDYNSAGSDSLALGDWNASTVNTITKDNVSNYINGTLASTNTACSFSLDIPFYLGTINGSGTPATYYFVGRIYSCKIWDAQGTLVRDFIPVRKGTVGYLYDRVSGKLFGNAGTGDFVLGPDVVPVEYIESHGTEWIDTGLVWDSLKWECVADITATLNIGENYIISQYGSGQGAVYAFVYMHQKNARLAYNFNNSDSYVVNNQFFGTKHTWHAIYESGAQRLDIGDNIHLSASQQYVAGLTEEGMRIIIGGMRTYGGKATGIRFGNVMIAHVSTSVRSFRPVRVGTGTTWEGAMMDTLTRRIYRNAGTGAFTYGNDLKYPIPAE